MNYPHFVHESCIISLVLVSVIWPAGHLRGGDCLRLLNGHTDECLTVSPAGHVEDERRSVIQASTVYVCETSAVAKPLLWCWIFWLFFDSVYPGFSDICLSSSSLYVNRLNLFLLWLSLPADFVKLLLHPEDYSKVIWHVLLI